MTEITLPTLPRKILLVEPDHINAMITSKVLHNAGFQITHVTNGLDAITAFDQVQPDFLIMETQLKDMDGIDLYLALETKIRAQIVCVIALSTEVSEAQKQRAFEYGFKQFLSKPFNKQDLLTTLSVFVIIVHEVRQAKANNKLSLVDKFFASNN